MNEEMFSFSFAHFFGGLDFSTILASLSATKR